MKNYKVIISMGIAGALLAYIFKGQITRPLSAAGLALLKMEEGLKLKPYKDVAGFWTIGYGHKIKPGEKFTEITPAQAEALLQKDTKWARKAVEKNVDVPLSDNQFAALVSLVYNIGETAFAKSTLLRRLNEGKLSEAANHILDWKFAGGEPVLLKRRQRERDLFLA